MRIRLLHLLRDRNKKKMLPPAFLKVSIRLCYNLEYKSIWLLHNRSEDLHSFFIYRENFWCKNEFSFCCRLVRAVSSFELGWHFLNGIAYMLCSCPLLLKRLNTATFFLILVWLCCRRENATKCVIHSQTVPFVWSTEANFSCSFWNVTSNNAKASLYYIWVLLMKNNKD